MYIDRSYGSCFNIFRIEESGVKDENGSEIFVPATRIKKSAFLNVGLSTMSFSAIEKSGGR